jgi:hypothetical protein
VTADCSRADLVRLLRAPEPGLFDRCALLLGFERRPQPTPRSRAPSLPGGATTIVARPDPKPEPPLIKPSEVAYLGVAAAHHVEVEDTSKVTIVPLPGSQEGDPRRPRAKEPDPLVPWPRLWRRLRPHLCEPVLTHEVDVRALVRHLARAETVSALPRLMRTRLAPTRK